MTQFLIGADPEVFIHKGGKPVAAHGVIPGTKDAPHKCENGAYQVDGLALEFNIDPVPLTENGFDQFNRNIVSVVKQMKAAASETLGPINISQDCVAVFGKEYIESLPDEAKVLGCDPDWNAYTLQLNPPPNGDVDFRVTGGHIHIGFAADQPVDDPEYIEMVAGIIRVLDLFVGMPLKFLDRNEQRRQMYGKAGAFRPKSYGVEYRSPSNWWIFDRPRRKAIYHQVQRAIAALNSYAGDADRVLKLYAGLDSPTVQKIVDEGTAADALPSAILISSSPMRKLIDAQVEKDNAGKKKEAA